MKQIVFWGMQHGVGVTSSVSAVAALIGMEYQIRTLVAQPQCSENSLEHAFLKSISQYSSHMFHMSGSGLDALERLARSGKLDRESIKNNARMIEKDRLDLLSSTRRRNIEEFDSDNVFSVIFEKAREYYSAIFLDVHSGTSSNIVQRMLKESDFVVICVNQNIHVLEKYFRKEEWPEALKGKPHVLLVSEYDPISKYKIKNIANKFEYRAPILTIPYLTEFKDALNDGDVKGFFYRNQSIQKGHQNYLFMHEIRRAASVILNESGVNVLTKKIERGAS